MIALLPLSEGIASHDWDGRWADWHNIYLPVILGFLTVIQVISVVRGFSGSENKVSFAGGSTEGNIRTSAYVHKRYRLIRKLWFGIILILAPFIILILGIAVPTFMDTMVGFIVIVISQIAGVLWNHYLGVASYRHLFTGIIVAGANAVIIIGLWGWYWMSFDSTPFNMMRAAIGLG